MTKKAMHRWSSWGWQRRSTRIRKEHDRLERLGIRIEPLPPALPPRSRRFTDVDICRVEASERTQHMCPLIARLPREIRLMIYSYVLTGSNLLIRLQLLLVKSNLVAGKYWRERLIHSVSSGLDSSDFWKDWPEESCFWPDYGSQDFTPLLPLLQSCRFIYSDAIDMPYSSNNFLFRDPYTLLSLGMQVPSLRLDNIRHIFLKWHMNGCMWEIDPRQRATWVELWQTLSRLSSLKQLKVNLPCGDALPWDRWTHDLWWVEAVKLVTTPSDFELLVPVDIAAVDLDMSPTACRIIGHPNVSAPAISTGLGRKVY